MTNCEVLRIAMTQSAVDSHCSPNDFMTNENKVVISEQDDRARRYLALFKAEHCFETPNLLVLQDFWPLGACLFALWRSIFCRITAIKGLHQR